MTGKVIQGSFFGGRPKLVPQPRIPVPSPIQAKPAVRLPGPPRPVFQGRTQSVASPIQPQSLARPPGPPAPAFADRPAAVQRHGAAFAVEAGSLGLASGGGKPLPAAVRGKMEAALSADFSNIRVHVGPQAERIGAIAFTVGSDIYFAPGRYEPDTPQGQQLLGHELAHVVQQRAGRVRNLLNTGIAVVQDHALEAEADRLGRIASAHRVAGQAKLRPDQPKRGGSFMVHARGKGAVGVTGVLEAQHRHGIGRMESGKSANYRGRTAAQAFRTNRQVFVVDNKFAGEIRGDQFYALVVQGGIWSHQTWTRGKVGEKVRALPMERSRWLYFALQFLLQNKKLLEGPRLNIEAAANTLLDVVTRNQIRARAVNPQKELNFGREVLRIIGYRRTYLAERLTAPESPEELRQYFEREERPQKEKVFDLDEDLLRANLGKDLIALMENHDPGAATSIELSEDPLKTAKEVNRFAKNYFRPYIAAIENLPVTVGTPLAERVVRLENEFPEDLRVNLLANRAEQLPLLTKAHFNSSRERDRQLLDAILRKEVLETDGVRALVDRHLRVTPRHGRSIIRLQSSFQWSKDHSKEHAIAKAQWKRIGSISHELMHFYCHKDFEAKEKNVQFGQVIIEGFTDLLGLDLLEALQIGAKENAVLRKRLRGEASDKEFEKIAQGSLGESGYDAALERAKAIQNKVGKDNVRAAYFLGKPELIGL
jgi:hypothetical protein